MDKANESRDCIVFMVTDEFAVSERRSLVSWYLRTMAVGLIVGGLCAPGWAGGKKGGPGPGLEPETCSGDHGTNVHFEKNVKDAAAKALKQEKLVLAIHISGYFEDPDYT
jgi:hypothetical protein